MDRADHLLVTADSLTETTGTLFARYVKPKDLPEFRKLQERNQDRIRLLFVAFELIEDAPTRSIGYDLASAKLPEGRGYRPDSLRRAYAKWRERYDWRDLIDKALEAKPTLTMPQEFIDEVQDKVDQNIRSIQAALKQIRAAWMRGEEIPGYGSWRQWWIRQYPGRRLPKLCPGYPHGWSVANLRRKLDKSKFRRIAHTRGLTLAKKLRPTMQASRVGIQPGQAMMWDDKEHDMFTTGLAAHQQARTVELYAHCYAAAYKTFFGVRQMVTGDDGKKQKLSMDMMRMVVAGHYWIHGYLRIKINKGERNEGALKFGNLIGNPDTFEEDLNLALEAAKGSPSRPRLKPTATAPQATTDTDTTPGDSSHFMQALKGS